MASLDYQGYRLPQTFEGFQALLDGPLDEKVLQRAFLLFPAHIQLAHTKQQAEWVYNRALRAPGTSTKAFARQHEGLLIGDCMNIPNVASKSALVYAFKDRVPMLLKIPSSEAAEHEAQVWQALSEDCSSSEDSCSIPPGLAGPIKLLTINEHVDAGKASKLGLIMPLYPATLQHIPAPVPPEDLLAIGQEVHAGLQHMHQRGWAHCDVKSSNIFLAADGRAVLGDYGASRRLGQNADEKTWRHTAVDLPAAFQSDRASVQLDEYLLAVTLVQMLGLLPMWAEQLTVAELMSAVMQVPTAELKSFISNLLKSIDVQVTAAASNEGN